jgi:hypothetical protein
VSGVRTEQRPWEDISAFLSRTGHLAPDCGPVGFIQVWRAIGIYVYWHSVLSYIKWEDVDCTFNVVSGTDDRGRHWEMTFTTHYVGWARSWPFWLLDDGK